MTTNQEGLHLAVRDITGTTRSYNEDWHALFDADGIPSGSFNSRMLAWINATLSASYTNLNEAMQAFAVEQGFANWASMNTFVAGSEAATFLRTYGPYGMVMNFADDASIAIKESSGVLDFTSQGQVSGGALVGPRAKTTYSAPSVKNTEQEDGFIKFQAHNLYLNSASPANQSITVLSGASYAITITGSVSMVASGAATGTWTAGTTTFTAATGTLTLGSTSGSGTVHLRRTPSVDTYIATTSAASYDLPYVYSGGVRQGILPEPAATNLALRSNDFTNASWTKSNMTTALTATGPDGVANSASTLTATAANATALQAITSASSSRLTSVYIKRRTGSGNIDLTQDNGTTWTTQTVTSSWTRVALSAVTSTNPTVGIRIVTSGDAVDVWCFQHETGTVATSPTITYGAAVARALDNITMATSLVPFSATEGTIFAHAGYMPIAGVARHMFSVSDGTLNEWVSVRGSSSNPEFLVFDSGNYRTIDAGAWPGSGDIKLAGAWAANDAAASVNGAAAVPNALAGTPIPTTVRIGGSYITTEQYGGLIKSVAVFPRRLSNAELQAITT